MFGVFGLLTMISLIWLGFLIYYLGTLTEVGLQILLVLPTLFLLYLASQAPRIRIDNYGITLVNPLLPFIRRTKSWTDFDCYVMVKEHSRYTKYEAVWFIRNGIVVARFSSFYYSNFKDLKAQIKTKNMGRKSFNPFAQLAMLLRLKRVKVV